MIDNLNNRSSFQNPTHDMGSHLDLSQKKEDFTLKEIPIYTMQEDLKNVGKVEPEEEPIPAALLKNSQTYETKGIPRRTALQEETSNPFLNPEKFIQADKKEIQYVKTSAPTKTGKKSALGKIFIIVIILLVAASSGYYFWLKKFQRSKSPSIENAINPASSAPQAIVPHDTTPAATSSFSTNSPNFFSLDLTANDKATIRTKFQEKAQTVLASGIGTAIEFVPVDAANNPIDTKKFISKFGINFSPAVSALFADNMSLFIYSDSGKPRMGMSIKLNSPAKAKPLMTKEELTLVKNLEPLFLGVTYTSETNIFNTGNYQNREIRYRNLTAPEDLSVDYAIVDDKLMIGTTKMTLRSMIDYFASSTNSTSAPSSALPAH